MASMNGKVALITGSSSGIGAAIARHFASLGCYLSLVGRNEDRLNKVGNDCQKLGLNSNNIVLQLGEMANDADLERIIKGTIDRFGQLDVLVNNAGMPGLGSLEQLCIEKFDEVININVRAVFYLSQLASPHLIKTRGTIVNISSAHSKQMSCVSLAYSISKYMLDQLTINAAIELAPHGVRVNSVCPGVIRTPIFESHGYPWEKVLKMVKRQYPIGRHGEATEVASVVAFLASDDSAAITGHRLPIDGGRHCMPGEELFKLT